MSELMLEEKPSLVFKTPDTSLTLENVEIRLSPIKHKKHKKSKRSKSLLKSKNKFGKESEDKKTRRVNFDSKFVNEIFVECWKKYNSEVFSQNNDEKNDSDSSNASNKKKSSHCNCISCMMI